MAGRLLSIATLHEAALNKSKAANTGAFMYVTKRKTLCLINTL